MPPKEKTKEQKAAEKAAKEKRAKNAEDKTFGLKNKNKSKAVQQQINQIKSSATAADRKPGQNKNEQDKKKESAKQMQQQALLAGLFNMAVDKKGRAFDPQAKKKAKEKNMEEERSGANLPEEVQKAFIEGIKNGIRMTNAKGTNLSQICGTAYVRDVLEDPKYKKHLETVTTLHFIRRHRVHFNIGEDDADNQNPSVRCQEDVDAEDNKDERDMFLILEEKRQPFFGDTSLKRVDMAFLKAWWLESARLELRRDPDTGEIRDEPTKARGRLAAKPTGEQLYKMNPNIFKHAGATGTDGAESTTTMATSNDQKGETPQELPDSDEDEVERDESVPVGKAWGESKDVAELESEKWATLSPKTKAKAKAKADPLATIASSSGKPPTEEYAERFDKVLEELPEDLGELESVSEQEES
ncbi:unnamed protein product [Amoebophrya sp. A120]|nr:unnamed protein product [Amoebophrya sp. A120]|eukprot:GSA120T00015389001.1